MLGCGVCWGVMCVGVWCVLGCDVCWGVVCVGVWCVLGCGVCWGVVCVGMWCVWFRWRAECGVSVLECTWRLMHC